MHDPRFARFLETFRSPPIAEIFQYRTIRRHPLGTINIALEDEIMSCQITTDILAIPVQEIIGPCAVYRSTKQICDDEYLEPDCTKAPNISIEPSDIQHICAESS